MTSELIELMDRRNCGNELVDTGLWVNFPLNCMNVVCFCELIEDSKGKEKFLVGDGFNSKFRLGKSIINIKNLKLDSYHKIIGDWNGYYFKSDNINYVVVISNYIETYEVFEKFFFWCKVEFSRMCIELPAGVNVMQVVDVIRRYNIRVRIVNQRGTSYDIVIYVGRTKRGKNLSSLL